LWGASTLHAAPEKQPDDPCGQYSRGASIRHPVVLVQVVDLDHSHFVHPFFSIAWFSLRFICIAMVSDCAAGIKGFAGNGKN
jgi:hypothetical protein